MTYFLQSVRRGDIQCFGGDACATTGTVGRAIGSKTKLDRQLLETARPQAVAVNIRVSGPRPRTIFQKK